MRRAALRVLAFAVSMSIAAFAGAQSQGMGGMDHDKCMEMMKKEKAGKKASKKGAQGATHKGTGTVQKYDPASGTVTIAHDPIKTMNWPAMTMTFTAKNKKMLEAITPGAKVEFEFVQQGSKYAITSIK